MKHLFLLFFMCILLYSFAHCQSLQFKPSFDFTLDTLYGSTLLKQCSRSVPKDINGFWLIHSTEIQTLENNFKSINKLTAKGCCITNAKIDSLEHFAFQFLGVLIKGKKFIYINAFPLDEIKFLKDRHLDATKTPVVVCDGGNNFWGVLFDIETKQFSFLAFNGAA